MERFNSVNGYRIFKRDSARISILPELIKRQPEIARLIKYGLITFVFSIFALKLTQDAESKRINHLLFSQQNTLIETFQSNGFKEVVDPVMVDSESSEGPYETMLRTTGHQDLAFFWRADESLAVVTAKKIRVWKKNLKSKKLPWLELGTGIEGYFQLLSKLKPVQKSLPNRPKMPSLGPKDLMQIRF